VKLGHTQHSSLSEADVLAGICQLLVLLKSTNTLLYFSCRLSYLFMVTVMFVFHYDHHHCADMVFLYINCSEPHFVVRIQEVDKIYAHVQCYATSCMASCL
jgi:hypothetical protein